MFQPLNPLLHSELRLAIMSLLISVKEAEFSFVKEKTGASAGNLSVQLSKLSEADYIKIEKTYKNNYPLTLLSITSKGIAAFEEYVLTLQAYIKK